MNEPRDISDKAIERALEQYLTEQRMTRRELIERIGALGAAVALAPIVAACSTGGASPSSAPSVATPSVAPSTSAAPTATPEPTPVPSPEAELIVYNWLDYIGEDVIPSFEEKYPVKVKYELFDDIEVAYAKLGQDGGGYDVSFPISVDVPRFVAAGTLIELDQSLLPNLVNLGPEWTDPGYDPGNKHSIPYVWWTTGIGYDSTKVTDSPTSSKALWDPRYKNHISMMDDYQEAFGMTLIQLGYSANTTDTTQLDEALALLKQQKPLLRTYSNDTIGTMLGGDVWIGQIWGSDLYQIQSDPAGKNVVYYIPEEGGVRGSDTAAIYSGAKHKIAAHLFLNHLLDAKVSASNTNFIGYMGPNEAAKEFITPEILADPAVNPDKAILEKLEELLDLPNAVDEEYLSRWQALKAGG